ncbi:uncharacterized protein [Clytia hemisphaerica]|uniref:Uncharacterized protein n=1 Tax=Clytia hemisphaerica TaxID=252671 RepID=A0A7M5WJJ1_9CNID
MASRSRKNSRNLNLNVRKSSYVFEYRITFLGAERVGKSAIINQFVEKDFLRHYQPTAEDHLTHVVEHRGNMCVCLLVDTAGSDDFPAMRKLSVTKGNAFIVTYSINDRKSYERAKKFIDEIKEVKEKSAEVKIVLVGNKNDLESDRQVPYTEALSFAANLHEGNVITAFVESSAKDYESVTEIIQKLLNMFIPPPPLIEVPVLKDDKRKLSLSKKLRASYRRTSAKQTLNRQLSAPVSIDTNNNNESFSDSEVTPVTPMSPESNRIITSQKRGRADSTPIVKVPQLLFEQSSSPESTSTPKHSRRLASRRTSSPLHPMCIQEIGDPVLISHSLTLNGYALPLQKTRSNSTRSDSSNDSGVSDDCSPEMPKKFNAGRRASLPVHNTQPLYAHGGRRASISEKMKGMFRKKSSSELM